MKRLLEGYDALFGKVDGHDPVYYSVVNCHQKVFVWGEHTEKFYDEFAPVETTDQGIHFSDPSTGAEAYFDWATRTFFVDETLNYDAFGKWTDVGFLECMEDGVSIRPFAERPAYLEQVDDARTTGSPATRVEKFFAVAFIGTMLYGLVLGV